MREDGDRLPQVFHNYSNIICVNTNGIEGRKVTGEEPNWAIRNKNENGGGGRAALAYAGTGTKCINCVARILVIVIIIGIQITEGLDNVRGDAEEGEGNENKNAAETWEGSTKIKEKGGCCGIRM